MLFVPQFGRLRYESNIGPNANGSPGALVTTGSTSSTKGTAVQLIAATSFDAYWVRIMVNNYGASAVASPAMLDLMLGTDPGQIIIPNLIVGYSGSAGTNKGSRVYDFNLYIPSGSRISVQAAGQRVSTSMRVSVHLYGGHGYPGFKVGTKVTTYGVTTVPAGTTIATSSNGVAGNFTQITSGTTENHFAFIPGIQPAGLTSLQNQMLTTEIGAGSAPEDVISPPYWLACDVSEMMDGYYNPMPTFADVPSGTRLALRISGSNPSDGNYTGVIHAVS